MPQLKSSSVAYLEVPQQLKVTEEYHCAVFSCGDRKWQTPTINKLKRFIKDNDFNIEEVIVTLCAQEEICGLLFRRAYHVAEFAKMFPQHLKLLCEQKVLRQMMDQGYVVADMIAASPSDADYLLNDAGMAASCFSGSDLAQIISARPDLARTLCETPQLENSINNESDLLTIIKAAPSVAQLLVVNKHKYLLLKSADALFSLVEMLPQYANFLLHQKGLYHKLAQGKILPEKAYAMLRDAKLTKLDPAVSKIANIKQKSNSPAWQKKISGWVKRIASA